jgi:hypothetical protein
MPQGQRDKLDSIGSVLIVRVSEATKQAAVFEIEQAFGQSNKTFYNLCNGNYFEILIRMKSMTSKTEMTRVAKKYGVYS